MFNVNSSFYKFLTNLQDKLQVEFYLDALSENACLLHPEQGDIRVVFYLCGSTKRVAINSSHRYIHIDEDLFVTHPVLVINRIAALAGKAKRINARDTVVARIEKPLAMAFQKEHHLNEALPGKYKYGLFEKGELVAISIFSGGRKMNNKPADYRSYELLRFCHKQGVHVVGGFSKLVDAFHQEVGPGDIMTYADKDWSDGSSYRKTGFEIVGETEPQVFWVDRSTMQRYAENRLLPEVMHKSTDELEALGYARVCNSGSLKLVKNLVN